MDRLKNLQTKKLKNNWRQRTSLEKSLIAAVTILLLLAIGLLLKSVFFPFDYKFKNVCMTERCVRSAAKFLKNMDPDVDPCVDFYDFTCGNFIKTAHIPDNQIGISPATHIFKDFEIRIREIFQEPIKDHDLHFVKLMKATYTACLNSSKYEQENLENYLKLIKDLGGWPVLDGNNWNSRDFDWKKILYRIRPLGLRRNFFVNLYIGVDDKNSSRRLLTISQGCVSDRLKNGFNDSYVKANHELMLKTVLELGAEKVRADVEITELLNFRIELANITIPSEQRKNSSLEYNLMTIHELQSKHPSFDWLQYINSYLAPVESVTGYDTVNVALPQYLTNLENLLAKTSKRVIANYVMWQLIWDALEYLPKKYQDLFMDYRTAAFGKLEREPKWKECVHEVYKFTLGLSNIYVKHFFKKSSRSKVTEIVADIKKSFIETLKNTGWMDRKTKIHALQKAEKMQTMIGYPDEVADDNRIEEFYKNLDFGTEENLMKLNQKAWIFFNNYRNTRLKQPIIKGDWRDKSYSFVMNAFYELTDNSIELHAGMLQDPFFDEDRPQYLNYGSIGYVIGHEITHGFDDGGRQYDKDGNLVDWWEPETNKTFSDKTKCLIEQYSNYTIPGLNVKVNGRKTLGENIADNGGIKNAYRGYMRWLERNREELMLPGLDFTPKQMFWVSAASVWCSKYKDEIVKNFINNTVHSPNHYRVIVPFMNSEYFAKDFQCPLGSPMNPVNKCRVW